MAGLERIVVAHLALATLFMAADQAQARRIAKADQTAFAESGESWDNNLEFFSDFDTERVGAMPFLMDFGSGAAAYDWRFTRDGEVFFTNPNVATFGRVKVFGTHLDYNFLALDPSSATLWGAGLVDETPEYLLSDATQTMRFSWFNMCAVEADPNCETPVYAQLIVADRGNGDFDLQFNYGFELNGQIYGYPTPAFGQQGYEMGSNTLAYHFGPHSAFGPDYCFRGGVGAACNFQPVPEPAALPMFLIGLAGLVAWQRRQAACRGAG